jgi:acyl-CoA thioester hydrolase
LHEPSASRPRRAVPPLGAFPYHATDIIRLGDLDHQNHVNNVVYATYLETGRVMLMRDTFGSLSFPTTNFVVARLEINYLRELHWPGTVTIGSGVEHIGRSSVVFAQAVFHGGDCAASGRTTMVLMDSRSRTPARLPEDILARLKPLAMPAT